MTGWKRGPTLTLVAAMDDATGEVPPHGSESRRTPPKLLLVQQVVLTTGYRLRCTMTGTASSAGCPESGRRWGNTRVGSLHALVTC